jgi:hypothetical protein
LEGAFDVVAAVLPPSFEAHAVREMAAAARMARGAP